MGHLWCSKSYEPDTLLNYWSNIDEKCASGENSESSRHRRWRDEHQAAGDGAKRAAQNPLRSHHDGGQNGPRSQGVRQGLEVRPGVIGISGPIINRHPLREPHNLGGGWMKINFSKAFGCPVKILNDAAMQALGSYKGGRMLFLGLGTGLGSAMIVDGMLEPMELAHLTYKNGKTYEETQDRAGSRLRRPGRGKHQEIEEAA